MNPRSNPHHDGIPSAWVRRHAHLVAPHAHVLDLAAGHGRHARFFAGRGARVTAVDRDAVALAEVAGLPHVTTHVADLESDPWPFGDSRFDAIVVVHYLHRPLLALLRAALAPGGVVLYETFCQGNELYGRPSNPDFLLAPGELLRWAQEPPALTVVGFEQGVERSAERAAVLQRLAAVGPAWPWAPPLPSPAP